MLPLVIDFDRMDRVETYAVGRICQGDSHLFIEIERSFGPYSAIYRIEVTVTF